MANELAIQKIRGRNSKLTPKIQAAFITGILKYQTIEDICDKVRIDSSTYYRWLDIGKESSCKSGKSHKYQEFYSAIKEANEKVQDKLLEAIEKAGTEGFEQTNVNCKEVTDSKGNAIKTVNTEKRETSPQWQACAWLLERRFPKKWGKQSMIESDEEPRPMAAFYVVEADDTAE
jgi:transposase